MSDGPDKATLRHTRKTLREHVDFCLWFEIQMDAAMKLPESSERGRVIAKLMNKLTLQNQSAMHFGLDYSFPKINRIYKAKTGKELVTL
jgi:hypothetical protein